MQQILNICWPAVTVFQQRGNFCVTLVLCPPGGAVTAPIPEYQLRLLSVSGPAAASSEAAAGAGRGGPPRSTQPQAELSKGLLRLKPTQAFGGISLILEEQG